MQRPDLPRIALQALAWVGLWAVVFLIVGGGFDAPFRYFRRLFPLLIAIGAVVFVNGAVLVPSLYFRGRRGWYVVAAVALVVATTLVLQNIDFSGRRFPVLYERLSRNRNLGQGTLRYLLPLATSVIGSVLVDVMRYAGQQEKRIVQAQREQLATELKFLKSQVNPHFLFNTLNNIYTLTLLRDDKAPESLLKLSAMLRYMLYDAEIEVVPLGREIDYLRNYVALRGLKDSRGLNVTVELDDSRPELPVAPLLLIPFVENAYKHSRVEDREAGYITVALTTGPTTIDFRVTNSVPPIPSPVDGVGGIGLDNVRKRLELLYPDRHQLTVDAAPERFSIHLQLRVA
ncbi:histidine kinase [Neolewinella xylanilytica]|uniref:Histidine kinase n=1 Tax=Neolewinella xylanilytica TaxID=1514080 RepID=A0A2S6I7X4_9BACT|nr:histidine kinase [Neolewinella xylanilytica]PPK87592.1 histidine kinase [Neolewinella xylanilytica]